MISDRRTQFLTWSVGLCVLSAIVSACSREERRREDSAPVMAQTDKARSQDQLGELKRQIEAFAEYGGEKGETARKFLEVYPPGELVAGIQALNAQAGEDETLKTELAFVLCFFGHDYDSNRTKIIEALRASRSNHRFDSVGIEQMIRQLIRRGDAGLLSELFNAATWSDGALSEGLAGTFAESLVSNPNGFLLTLSGVSSANRRAIYTLIDGSSLSQDELTKVKKNLASESIPARLRPVAIELLASLREH